MGLSSIAIVGRPNVGKSTLFNTLIGSRVSIEAATSGVTRDRVLVPMTVEDRTFDLLDTGGIGIVDRQHLNDDVEWQITAAIEEASALLFLVDVRDGITPLDLDVADRLRRANKPVLLVASKADTPQVEAMMDSFHSLGFGDALAVSSKHRRNIETLKEKMLELLPPEQQEDSDHVATRDLLRIAFVGRRNVGKSSMINQLVGSQRVIVSDTPGTTRDSVDVRIERDGEAFVAIDTAGLRRRNQMDDIMEFYGQLRSERAVRRADVVVLMLDVTTEISKVDKKLGHLIVEDHKPCIIALNKWDLAREENPKITLDDFSEYLNDKLPGMWFCPMVAVSALSGENAWGLIAQARKMAEQAAQKAGTGEINRAIAEAQKRRRPRPQHGKLGKMYYATQVSVSPPTFLVFCNNPKAFDDGYIRYLQNFMRKTLGYPDVPLRLLFRTSHDQEH